MASHHIAGLATRSPLCWTSAGLPCSLALFWFLVLGVACGCRQDGTASPRAVIPGARVADMQSGQADAGESGTPEEWIARAQAFEASKRPVEALMAYRTAMRLVPEEWPGEKREALEGKIARLSFLMGVPGQVEVPVATPRAARPPDTVAVETARGLLERARRAEQAGKRGDALSLYRKVIETISATDDSTLYWRAWQSAQDLSPEGEGPADEVEKKGEEILDAGTFVKPDEDGMFLRTNRRLGMGQPEIRLQQARTAYVSGMAAADEEDREAARRAFETVVKLIEEHQDPELYRAARENLEALRRAPGQPTPPALTGP